MSPLEPRNSTTADPEVCHPAEAQDKDLQRTFMNILEAFKDEMNKSQKSMKTQIVRGSKLNSSRYKGGNRIDKEISN